MLSLISRRSTQKRYFIRFLFIYDKDDSLSHQTVELSLKLKTFHSVKKILLILLY